MNNSGFDSFFWTLIVAFLFQNVIFARGFGTGRIMKVTEDRSLILPYTAVITVSTVCSSVFGWLVSLFDFGTIWDSILEPLIFIIPMVGLYCVARLLLRNRTESWARKAYYIMSPAVVNTTVLGTVLVAYRGNYTLLQYLGLSVGTGLGFAAAAYIINGGLMRIEGMEIGSSFRGLPIKLIYIGIIAVGIYGFIGKSILL